MPVVPTPFRRTSSRRGNTQAHWLGCSRTAAERPGRCPPLGSRGRAHVSLVDLARGLCLSVWFAPALATAAICLWRMARPWSDELTSYDVARRSLAQVVGTIRHVDAVHGAYYVLLHLWISMFGTSLTVLRLPGVLGMVGAAVSFRSPASACSDGSRA